MVGEVEIKNSTNRVSDRCQYAVGLCCSDYVSVSVDNGVEWLERVILDGDSSHGRVHKSREVDGSAVFQADHNIVRIRQIQSRESCVVESRTVSLGFTQRLLKVCLLPSPLVKVQLSLQKGNVVLRPPVV